MKYIHQASVITCIGCSSKKNNKSTGLAVVGDTTLNYRLQSKHSKSCIKARLPKWPRQDQLDNGSYSTIQPPTCTTYNMKIEVWPAILKFFDNLSQKSIRTTQQNSHQFRKS